MDPRSEPPHHVAPGLLDAIQPEHLRQLLTISVLLNSTLDLRQLLSLVIEAATELTDTEVASILLVDSLTGELKFVAATGVEQTDAFVVPMEGSLAGWIVQNGQPLILDDVQADERHYQGVDSATRFVTRSLLGVPLTTRGRVIGALEALNKRGDAGYSTHDVVALQALASQAAVAIDNARLFQQSDLVAEIMHELKTPLMSLAAAVEALNRADLPPEQRDYILYLARQETQRLTRMTQELLDFARLESGRATFAREAFDLGQLIKDAAAMQRPLAAERSISFKLELPDEPFIFVGDPGRFKQLLLNLTSNAIKYNKLGGQVTISLIPAEDNFTLAVKDAGPGIPPELRERLFERFYRLPDSEGFAEGSGLGLAIVKKIVEGYRGRVEVDSVLGAGATFRCLIPCAEA
jgi:signal transduction histidine kinase